jgi:hypothetical protein
MYRKALLGLVVAVLLAVGALIVAGAPGAAALAGGVVAPATASPTPTPIDTSYAVILRSGGMGDEHEWVVMLANGTFVPLDQQKIFTRLGVGNWAVRLDMDITGCAVQVWADPWIATVKVDDPAAGTLTVKTGDADGKPVDTGYKLSVSC